MCSIKKHRDCTTCAYREVVDYLDRIANCTKGKDESDGYPRIGEKCLEYVRIPGSDDDYQP